MRQKIPGREDSWVRVSEAGRNADTPGIESQSGCSPGDKRRVAEAGQGGRDHRWKDWWQRCVRILLYVQCKALDKWMLGLGLCILKDYPSCFVENGLEEGEITRRLLQQFRCQILMTWTKVVVVTMNKLCPALSQPRGL